MASHFSVSAWEMGQKSGRQYEEMLLGQESKSQCLGSAWITQSADHCYRSLVCNVFFHTMVENPTHTSWEECESIAILLTNLWWINSLQTVKNPKCVGFLYLSFPEPQLKQRCFLISCWQLICSRFAFCLKSSTSPAWKATMFSLGQQNRANAAFIFHPNPRWGRYSSRSDAQVLSATRLGMSFAL